MSEASIREVEGPYRCIGVLIPRSSLRPSLHVNQSAIILMGDFARGWMRFRNGRGISEQGELWDKLSEAAMESVR